MKVSSWLLTLIVAACLTGCHSTNDSVRQMPLDRGIAKSFDAPYEDVAVATISAAQSLNQMMKGMPPLRRPHVTIIENKDEAAGRVILLQTAVPGAPWQELSRVLVAKSTGPSTRVIVSWPENSDKEIAGIDGQGFSDRLFAEIKLALPPR